MVAKRILGKYYKINVKLLTLYLFFPIFIILGFISTFLPVTRGIASFPLKSIQCGHEPFITNTLAGSRSYTIPGDRLYSGPNIFTQPNNYYCDESEAIKTGYTAVTWKERCQATSWDLPKECSSGKDAFGAVLPFFLILTLTSVLIAYLSSTLLIKRHQSSGKNRIK